MSGMKRTPGDWEHRRRALGCVEQVYSTHGNGCLVATCDPACTPDAADNARFIARAPQLQEERDTLLAACKSLEATLIPYRGHDASPERTYLCGRILVQNLRAAIAKAEGKE